MGASTIGNVGLENLDVASINRLRREERSGLGRFATVLATKAEVCSLAEIGVSVQELLADRLALMDVVFLLEPLRHSLNA